MTVAAEAGSPSWDPEAYKKEALVTAESAPPSEARVAVEAAKNAAPAALAELPAQQTASLEERTWSSCPSTPP